MREICTKRRQSRQQILLKGLITSWSLIINKITSKGTVSVFKYFGPNTCIFLIFTQAPIGFIQILIKFVKNKMTNMLMLKSGHPWSDQIVPPTLVSAMEKRLHSICFSDCPSSWDPNHSFSSF